MISMPTETPSNNISHQYISELWAELLSLGRLKAERQMKQDTATIGLDQ